MLDTVNEMAIVVSALLTLAIGSIWYSPLVFGSYWLSAAGLFEADLRASKKNLIRAIIYACIANIFFAYAIARLVALAEAERMAFIEMCLLLVILLGAVMANVVVWEKKPLSYLAIHIGYISLVVCFTTIVIAFWSW